MKKELKIRKLKVRDNRLLQGMLRSLIKDSGQAWISKLMRPTVENDEKTTETDDGTRFIGLFVDIIVLLSEKYETQVTAWFADLCEMTVEQYYDLDFDADVIVVKQISEAEEFSSFFSKAWVMFKETKLYENAMKKIEERFGSMTD
jgi:hypothetical protein